MDGNALKILNEHEWGETIVKLTAYIINYCKWKNYRLPKGLEAEDIAMTAIEKVYAEERKWNPEKEPDLYNYLKSVVNSIISNEIESSGATEISTDGLPEHLHITCITSDEEMYSEQLDNEISTAMRGDPISCLVYKALKDGLMPREIAEEYAIEIEQVRLAQKRLRRLAEKVIDQLSKVYEHEGKEEL